MIILFFLVINLFDFDFDFQVMGLLLLVADLMVYVLYLSPTAFDSLPLRIAPYIRVIFFILNFRYCV